jgi:hypothetical protein
MDVRILYERVVREAMHVEDLRAYLHRPTLCRVWPQPYLPRKARDLWEARFGALAPALTAPAVA